MWTCTKVCQSVWMCTKVYQSAPMCTNVYKCVQKCVKVYSALRSVAKCVLQCASHYAPLFSVLVRGHWSYNYRLFHGGFSWWMWMHHYYQKFPEKQTALALRHDHNYECGGQVGLGLWQIWPLSPSLAQIPVLFSKYCNMTGYFLQEMISNSKISTIIERTPVFGRI